MCHLFVFHETTNSALQPEGLRNHVSSFYSWSLCSFLRCCITARGSEKALRNCTSSRKEKTRQKKKQIKAKRSVCYKYTYIIKLMSCHQFSCHSAQIFWGQFDVSFWPLFLHPHSLQTEVVADTLPAQIELLGSFNSLITSMEQLQSGFLLNPDSFSEELATPPRKILNTLR